MSDRSAKPGQLGGRQRLDPQRACRRSPRRASEPGSSPATAAVPWPITCTCDDRAAAQGAAHVVGQLVAPEVGDEQAVALDELAPQRLAERCRRLADLLEQEVRRARRDRCRGS